MPVSGLVLTLDSPSPVRAAIIAALVADRRMTVGELQAAGRLPVVTEADTLDEQQALWDEIARLPGVLLVDLAYEDFSDIDDLESSSLPRRVRREERDHEPT